MQLRSRSSSAAIHLSDVSTKRTFFFAAVIALASLGLPSCHAQVVRSERELNKAWTFRQTAGPVAASRANWMPATVPGDVHLDLLKQKLIADPFYRDNESKLQWIENASWEYETTVVPTSAEIDAQNLDLVFDGLDATCKVYLNDKLVLDADNMHRSWRVPVKMYMHSGSNKLHVGFPSPIVAAHAVASTVGLLFWQLNDCWPVASWSSIDSSGRWKALQYYAQRFYRPVLVSPHVEYGAVKTYIVSDKTQSESGVLRVRLMDFNGKVLLDNLQSIKVDPLSSKVEAELPLSKITAAGGADLSQDLITTEWTPNRGESSRNLLYLVPTKQIHLPSLKLSTELTGEQGAYTQRITSPKIARSVHLSFGDLDASVSDDFFDLLPGETRSIRVNSVQSLSQLRNQLSVMSLVDAFSDSNGKTVATNTK
jgi:beta-galactosidase/beta-glucuronidase